MIPDPQVEGDFEQMGLGARGESAERIHSVRPAAAIVKDMLREGARDCGRKGEEQEDVHKGLCMVDAGPRTALLVSEHKLSASAVGAPGDHPERGRGARDHLSV